MLSPIAEEDSTPPVDEKAIRPRRGGEQTRVCAEYIYRASAEKMRIGYGENVEKMRREGGEQVEKMRTKFKQQAWSGEQKRGGGEGGGDKYLYT